MSIKKTIIVYLKELLDLFRDKRTIVTSIVVPIILYPLIMIGFNSLMARQTIKLYEQEVIVYVLDNSGEADLIINALESAKNIQLYQQTDYYEKLLEERIIHLIVKIDSVEGKYWSIEIKYNSVDERSSLAFSNIANLLKDVEEEIVIDRLHLINISEDILKAIDIKDEDIASDSQALGLILSKILPYFLILISISGAAVAAVDLVAGEKERGTLETVLVSAVGRNELVTGKFLAVITIAMLTVVLNLASIFFSFRHIMSQAAASSVNIEIPIFNLLLIFILMFPMIVFFSSLLLSISTYSRNMKEGYSYTQPLMIIAMLFSLVSTLPAIDNSLLFTLIPVINVSLTIRDILTGSFDVFYFFSTFISTLILVIISILISIKLFKSESILFRTSEEVSMFNPKSKWAMNPNFALLFFFAILLAFYYLGISWQMEDLETGLIKTLVFLILLPTLVIIKIGKLNFKEVLRLNATKIENIPIVLLIAIPLFIIVTLISQLINTIFPFPDAYLESFEKIFFLQERTFLFSFFLIALLPGLCEEVMFRGYFLKVFEKKGIRNGIIISGILFGIIHLDIYRFVPVTILGMWMGYLLMKTNSIIIPIIAHTANNAFALVLMKYGESIPGVFLKDDNIVWWLAIPALITFFIFYILLDKTNKNNDYYD